MKDYFGYNNKICVVTGAASGIGKATAELLVELNAEVYALDITKQNIPGVKEFIEVDLSNKEFTGVDIEGANLERTNAKIVLSSYWRYYFDKDLIPNDSKYQNHGNDLILKLRKHNLSLKDKTSTDLTRFEKRGDIIKEYLHTHEDIDNFVILDDDNIMKEFTDTNLIQTKPEYGLTMSDVKKAENILNKTKVKKL